MKTYRVGRLEIHEFFEEVEANDPIEALQKIMDGEGTPLDSDGDSYVELCHERGMPIDELLREFPDLNNKKDLERLNEIAGCGEYVSTVRSIEQDGEEDIENVPLDEVEEEDPDDEE